jgi:hypothetical protein
VLVWTFDGEEFEGSDFGKDEDETGVEMATDTRVFAIGLPVVIGGGLEKIFGEKVKVGAGDVDGKVLLVEDGFSAGDVGEEASDGITVDAEGGLSGADDVGKFKTVGFKESFTQEIGWDFEADELGVGGGSEAEFAELVDVEGKLGLDVGVGIFGVVDG